MFIYPHPYMMNYPYSWVGLVFQILSSLFWLALIACFIWWIARRSHRWDAMRHEYMQHMGPPHSGMMSHDMPPVSAEEAARIRFAKGEITQEQLQGILDTLQSSRNAPTP